MRAKIGICLTAVTLLLASVSNAAEKYRIDSAHTSLTFSVRHMGIADVKGRFDEFEGWIMLENGVLKEAVGTVQVKSINTGVQKRDDHLRTPDFFDAAGYPVMTFKTLSIEWNAGQPVLIADFTIRGIVRELRLPVKVNGPIKDPQGNLRIGIEGQANLNRKDFGITFDAALDSGVPLIGETVAIEISAEAIKDAGASAGKP